MKKLPVKFPSGDLVLEGEWLFPDGEGPFPAVVVSHPFPPQGGSMDSSVVTAIWNALAEQRIAALRFNFRGVGKSEGSFNEGLGEREDVKAALEFVFSTAGIEKEKVGLAGYSFGSMMSAPVAVRDERVGSLALVSPPLAEDNWKKLDGYDKPLLVIIGENDQMVSLDPFLARMDKPSATARYRLIQNADHFFNGYEETVGQIVADFFTGVFHRK